MALRVAARGEGELTVGLRRLDLLGQGVAELALGTLDADRLALERDGDARGHLNRLLSDTGHGRLPQYTRQRTSPPTFSVRATLSLITPLGVERIEMPRPFFTGFRSLIEE